MSFEEKQEVGEALARYVRDFNERHDNMTIYNAIVHLDEAGALYAHFNVVPTATGYKMGLQSTELSFVALEQEVSWRDVEHQGLSKCTRLNLYMKLNRPKVGKPTIPSDSARNIKTRWNTLRIENQVRLAYEEKMRELDEQFKQARRKISRKREEAFKDRKRQQLEIKLINDEIMSKSELDIEMIKDETG